jgi:cobalt-zinc-cadmium resistance protein CzcA
MNAPCSRAKTKTAVIAKIWALSQERRHAGQRREEIADIKTLTGPAFIYRDNNMRYIAVKFSVRGRDLGSTITDAQQKVKADVALLQGYKTTWNGEFENQQRAMSRLSLIVPISVLLIFVLLFNAFGSVKHAALILVNVPFALIGGILALYVTGIHLSVSAAIGFIALFGQAVLNGVVMISYFNQLRRTGVGAYRAALDGSLVRLRTVLMTALLAMLGLTPMALSHSIGSEVQRPLAVVIIGGLVSAAALTLLVLPALYVMFEPQDVKVEPGT